MSLWKKLLWIAVSLLGLGALYVIALSRGEQINALWIIVTGAVLIVRLIWLLPAGQQELGAHLRPLRLRRRR